MSHRPLWRNLTDACTELEEKHFEAYDRREFQESEFRRLVALAFASVSNAHHSLPALFDTSTTVEISGRVTVFEFAAPHSCIHLSVVDEAGVETIWQVESYPPGMLVRKGLTPLNLEPGLEISATGIPSRDGRALMRLLNITMPDGEQRQIQ
ncbi:MAG: DUF6152 family protein [Rhodospirillaceae bacterium]|nr:DUF6152 family protein [Rhodospirillaceae bacterium]